MAAVKIRWTKLAVRDLNHAYDYIAANNPEAARATIVKISSALEALKAHPLIGRKGRVQGTRELIIPATPFIVAYRMVKARVEILGIIHGARRWPETL